MDNTYLMHHGIKGMHWGIRRYQKSDGTYTPLGAKRRNSSAENSALSDRQARKAIAKQRKWNAKNASLLSDNELNAQINRLQKEKQLKQLSNESLHPGKSKAAKILDRYGSQMASAAIGAVTSAVVARELSKHGFNVKGYTNGIPNNMLDFSSNTGKNGKKHKKKH